MNPTTPTSRDQKTVLFRADYPSLKSTLEAAVKSGVDLQNADLRGADLQGADLQGANLRGANLRGANLRGTNFHGTDFRGADLRGAELQNADLQGADLDGANPWGANLWGTNLRGAKIAQGLTLHALLTIGPIDGWPVLLFSTSAGLRVQVGCHFLSLEGAERYWRYKPARRHLYTLVTTGWKELVRLAGWKEKDTPDGRPQKA